MGSVVVSTQPPPSVVVVVVPAVTLGSLGMVGRGWFCASVVS